MKHALNVGFEPTRDLFNKQFSSYPKPLFQSEANCEAIDLKKTSYYPANKTDFNKSGRFSFSLVLKMRVFGKKNTFWQNLNETILSPNTHFKVGYLMGRSKRWHMYCLYSSSLVRGGLFTNCKFGFDSDPRLHDLQSSWTWVFPLIVLVLYRELIPSSFLNSISPTLSNAPPSSPPQMGLK